MNNVTSNKPSMSPMLSMKEWRRNITIWNCSHKVLAFMLSNAIPIRRKEEKDFRMLLEMTEGKHLF